MIYDLLKEDHKALLALIDQLIALPEDDDTSHVELVDEIREALIPHSRAEEAVFYNSIRARDADSGKVMHAYQEHVIAEGMLRSLQLKEKVNLNWKKTAIKLRDAIAHHIQEEEGEIFALARKVITDTEAEQIGSAFERLKAQVKNEGMMKTNLELIKNLMPPSLSGVVKLTYGEKRL